MNLWQPRHRRTRNLPPVVRIGAVVTIPAITAAVVVATLNGGSPGPESLRVQVDDTGAVVEAADPDADARVNTVTSPSPSGSPTIGPSGHPTGDDHAQTDDDTPSPSRTDSASPEPEDPYGRTHPPTSTSSPRPSETPSPTSSPTESPKETPSPTSTPDPTPTKVPPPTVEPTPDPTPSPEPTGILPPLPILSSAEEGLIDEVNELRAEAGCPALRIDGRLTEAARAHSEDMRARGFYSHTNPDGETPQDRAADEGYSAPVAENIARGLQSVRSVAASWENDDDARSTLLDCDYSSVGAGVEYGLLTSWWTLVLGRS